MNVSGLTRLVAAVMLLAFAVPALPAHLDPTSETFTFFAWRSLGHFSNGAPHIKVRAYIGSDGTISVGETGQAEQGWHELHPLPGPQTASFEENGDAYPTVAGPVMVGNKPEDWAVFDIPIYWLYEADNLVWGQAFRQMGQTFKASGSELDKVGIQLPQELDDLYAIVREGGPNGQQVGPKAKFRPGPSGDGTRFGWYVARWKPGELPLKQGKTYYLDIRRESGRFFSMRMHSTGDVYPDGMAYFEGKEEPGSDLGVFISMARDDMLRSIVLDSDEDNWVRNTTGVYFKARTENIRAIYAQIMFPNTPFHIDAHFRVYEVHPDGRMTRVGIEKKCYNYTTPGTEHYLGVIYAAADELPLEIGKTYFVEVVPKDTELPEDESLLPKRDLNVRIYGEKKAGMTPVIYNQHIVKTSTSSIELAWKGTEDSATRVYYGLSPYKLDKVINVPKGVEQTVIGSLQPGTTVSFRIVKTTRQGGKFETPVYQARTLGADGKPVTEPPLLEPPQHEFLDMCIGFLNLAVMDRMHQPPLPKVKVAREIKLQNPGFENGLNGWMTSGNGKIDVVETSAKGKASAGWDVAFPRHEGDYDRRDMIYQQVRVTRGKTYMLSASLYTLQEPKDPNWYGRFNLGDVRARLLCDPTGGNYFAGHNSTQWFRTDGQWLTFAKKWKADSDTMTIGVEFYRRTDWPKVVALVDEIKLVELAE